MFRRPKSAIYCIRAAKRAFEDFEAVYLAPNKTSKAYIHRSNYDTAFKTFPPTDQMDGFECLPAKCFQLIVDAAVQRSS